MEQAEAALKKYFGYDSFRPMQKEIIESVLEGKDTLVLMPTGGGKSICFQIPALIMEGLCVVVSPLIALMQDQVEGLKANGVQAEFINSSRSAAENTQVIHLAMDGKVDLLYVSPEKMLSPDFSSMLRQLNPSLFAVDEAHCISAWGHDFRPEYAQLNFLKAAFPDAPLIALTATADKVTRRDIVSQLSMQKPALFVDSFDRPNLSLNVLPGRNRYKAILDWVQARPGQSGIIYCLSRKSTEDLAGKLQKEGVRAKFYHAGMGPKVRAKVQQEFIRDDVPIICATIAFGMGIDKSNVRWVIHYNLPKNIEGYYQEIGRAGRDGLASDTLLFYSYADVAQLRRFLEDSGQRELGEMKLERMQQYANAKVCRRKVLLAYFGDHLAEGCGNCDVCQDPPETIDGSILAQKALSALIRLKEEVGSIMLVDVLRGSNRLEIKRRGFDKIKTYGAGSDISSADWNEYVLQILDQGLVEIAYDQGNSLKVTDAGKAVLYEGVKVELVKRVKTTPGKSKATKEVAPKGMQKVDEALFQKLRRLRKKIADENGLPPYIIFHDATLKHMAAEKPINEVHMRSVSGVGEKKMQLYGDRFINEILDFLQQRTSQGKPAKKGNTLEATFQMYSEGMTVEEIALQRSLEPTTIYSHLAQLYATGKHEIDLFRFLTVEELQEVLSTATQLQEFKVLKPIYEQLGERIPYHKIRLGLAYRARQELVDNE